MPRSLPTRRVLRHHLMACQPPHRAHGAVLPPPRTSDVVLAVLGVALLGALALAALRALAGGA